MFRFVRRDSCFHAHTAANFNNRSSHDPSQSISYCNGHGSHRIHTDAGHFSKGEPANGDRRPGADNQASQRHSCDTRAVHARSPASDA